MTEPIVIQYGGSPIVQQSSPTPVVMQRDEGAAVVVTQPTNTVVVGVAMQGPPGAADLVADPLAYYILAKA